MQNHKLMGNDYSEDQLIEQTCIAIFKNQLQGEIVNVYQRETFGEKNKNSQTSLSTRK